MAELQTEVLQLKVDDVKYQKTLDELQRQIDKLGRVQTNLETARETLERAYKGDEVADLIEAAKNYEQRTKDAIEDVTKKRQKISDYITAHGGKVQRATSSFSEERRKSAEPFG